MTLYDLIKIANDHFTPDSNDFFDYVICSSDDNGGFLRTCFHKKNELLKNYEIKPISKIIIAFQEPFDPKMLTFEYEEPFGYRTKTKLQFFYDIMDDAALEAELEWTRCVGYSFIEVIEIPE